VSESFWVDGTRSTVRLDGGVTQGQLALLEETLAAGPGPPLHDHPEAETFHVLEGELLLWQLAPGTLTAPLSAWPPGLVESAERCGPGSTSFVPGGAAHTYLVLSPAARILVISTPAGLEEWTREFGVPATEPGLGPTTGTLPEISADRRRRFAQAHGLRRLGPPPPVGAMGIQLAKN
jgi:hypothetical protein